MADKLNKKPVNGMKDILPSEMEIRDYVTSVIKDTYFETQNLIISTYFNKQFDKIMSLDDVEEFRIKLYNYKNIIGITEDYFFFNNYYIAMMEKLEAKRTAIENGTIFTFNTNTDVAVAKENKILAIFRAIKNLLFGQGTAYQKI